MISTRVTELLGIEQPIIQAGMASTPSPALVAAVSNAGGLGTLGAAYLSPDQIRAAVREIRDKTSRPFAVNLLLCFAKEAQVEAILDAGVPVVSTAWGDPGPVVNRAHAAGAKVIHMIQTVEGAREAAGLGVDVIAAQGSEAGGHIGSIATLPLVPQVVDVVAPIPVVAAGGIGDGRGLAAALALGAEGVLMGTRFLATVEASIHPDWKQAIVAAGDSDTIATEIPDIANGAVWPGARARALRNRAIERWLGREWELRRYGTKIGQAMTQARISGPMEDAALLAGEVVGLIHEVKPAGEVVREVAEQAEQILARRLPGLVK